MEKCLKSFKHYPVVLARKEIDESENHKYLVTTINGTYANSRKTDIDYDENKPSPNFDEVHKNEYIMTLEQLFKFKRSLYQVAETIIKIEPIIE